MLKKIKALFVIMVVVVFSTIGMVYADQPTNTQSGTINGTPDKYVEVVMENDTINFGTLNISAQKALNQRTDANGKYVIFDSKFDLTPAQNIVFNEGASNSNIFAKVTYTGEEYPLVDGLDSSSWLFLKDAAGTDYIQSQITGTLTFGGGGVTMPASVTEIGSYVANFVHYTTADAGVTWTRNTKNIYVALGDNGRLYVSDAANLTTASYYTKKGDAVSTPFSGNSLTETSTFPALVGDTATLDFGYNIAWDATQSNTHETFSTLIDLPMHAAYNHNWTWNLSVTGEFYSQV